MPDAVGLSLAELAARLAVAAALTAAIGFERELRDRGAGLRTHLLVGLGAALFTIVSGYGWSEVVGEVSGARDFDPTRIAAGIVAGVGFLGAGAIIRHGLTVAGLTTAATLWVTAAIGLAAGTGWYSAAGVTTGLVLLGLWPLRVLEGRLDRAGKGVAYIVELELVDTRAATDAIELLEQGGAEIRDVDLRREQDRMRVRVDLVQSPDAFRGIVDAIGDLERVQRVRWSR